MHLSPIHVTPDDHHDLANNPWLESSNGRREATNQSTTSLSANVQKISRNGISHTRSHTTAGHPLRAPSPPSAAESCPASGHASSLDLHKTCPSLRRVIDTNWSSSNGDNETNGGNTCEPNGFEARRETDAEVIVHQIRPTDSLPGVALKYNISLAALRSANKLWANDSIHLRQMLYIPVQSITQTTAKSVPTTSRQHTSSHSEADFSYSCMRRSVSEWGASINTETISPPSSMTQPITGSAIRRVPLSELSFFPPPSSSALPSHGHAGPRPLHPTMPLSSHPNMSSHPNTSQSNIIATPPRVSSPATLPFFSTASGESTHGTPTFGLTSFLNGAKDEIISRLSFDSTRGSSDAGGELGVEMDVVRSSGSAGRRGSSEDREWATRWDIKAEQNGSLLGLESEAEAESVILNTPRKPKVIRNIQLQPSPRMEIPAKGGVFKISNADGAQ